MATHNLDGCKNPPSGSEDQISTDLDLGPEDVEMKKINLTAPSSLSGDENSSMSLKGASTSSGGDDTRDDRDDNAQGYGNTSYVEIQKGIQN